MCALNLGSANSTRARVMDGGSEGDGVGACVRASTACRVGAGEEPKAPPRNSAPKTSATTTNATPAPTSKLGPDLGAGSWTGVVGASIGEATYLSTKKPSAGAGAAAIGSYFVPQRGQESSLASNTS